MLSSFFSFSAIFSMKQNSFLYHLLAVFVVAIWGTTFVATKVLIQNGLNPTEIFVYRFVLAYACIVFMAPKRMWSNSFADEAKLMLAGITGGSLYFITENTALGLTTASNVAMLIAISPLLTTLLGMAVFSSERSKKPERIILGSVIALIGVFIVIGNGRINLNFGSLGDLLTLCAALSWAVYSLLVKNLAKHYSGTFISRKVFGYGLLSIAIYIPFFPAHFHLEQLLLPHVWPTLLYLGVIASMVCFTAWNLVVNNIGMVKATNYININPIATFVSAYLVLGERITLLSLVGAACILVGVYLAEKK